MTFFNIALCISNSLKRISGVAMGVIGASAYLMPNARIKVFIWGYRFVNSYYIQA